MPIYLRYKWTKWRFQGRHGFSEEVRRWWLPGSPWAARAGGHAEATLPQFSAFASRWNAVVVPEMRACLPQRIEAEWVARHEWGGVRVHAMLLELSGEAPVTYCAPVVSANLV